MCICSVSVVVAAQHQPSPTLQNPKVGSNGGIQRGNPIAVCWGRAFAILTSRVAGPRLTKPQRQSPGASSSPPRVAGALPPGTPSSLNACGGVRNATETKTSPLFCFGAHSKPTSGRFKRRTWSSPPFWGGKQSTVHHRQSRTDTVCSSMQNALRHSAPPQGASVTKLTTKHQPCASSVIHGFPNPNLTPLNPFSTPFM